MNLRFCLLFIGTNNDSFNTGGIPDVGHTRRVSGYHTEVTSGGGLSVTGCLNNFSMFIFHPYGGMTKKTSFTSLESTFRKGEFFTLQRKSSVAYCYNKNRNSANTYKNMNEASFYCQMNSLS